MEPRTSATAAQTIGKLKVEEFPDGYRVTAPRRLGLSIIAAAVFFAMFFLLIPGQSSNQKRDAIVFYLSCGAVITLFYLTRKHVIIMSGDEIIVFHRNFGITWWKSAYRTGTGCEFRWVPARRKSPSSLELSCNGRKGRIAFDITKDEAAEVTKLIQQRFPNFKNVPDTQVPD